MMNKKVICREYRDGSKIYIATINYTVEENEYGITTTGTREYTTNRMEDAFDWISRREFEYENASFTDTVLLDHTNSRGKAVENAK